MTEKRTRGARRLALALASTLLASGFVGVSPAAADVPVNGDPALYWSSLVSTTIAGPPVFTSRSQAMAQIAIYEAANLTTGKEFKSYLGFHEKSGDTRAAIAVAARNVLVAVNPSRAGDYDAALTATLALVSDGQAKTDGIAAGNAISAATLARRFTDGSNLVLPYVPQAPGTPGAWQPTPNAGGAFPPALGAHWQNVTPWVMSTTDQFNVAPPPPLSSATYAADFEEVKTWGALNSAVRTAEQTAQATFWPTTAAGFTWQNIAIGLADDNGMSTVDAARMLALLALGNADTFIAVWDSKYQYDFWRPYTAIRNADIDGNALTDADAGWNSRIINPSYPGHSSGLSANNGNATAMLAAFFGDGTSFCVNGTGGSQRCFNSFTEAAQDGADSRIYGGIHFRFETEAGLAQGRAVANYVFGNALGVVPEPGTWSLLIVGFGMIGVALRRRQQPARSRLSFS